MKHGFIKVAAVTPDIRVADVWHNCEEVRRKIKEAEQEGAKIIVFPELCLTGYTCSDLFTQDILLKESEKAIQFIAKETKEGNSLVFVGMPLSVDGELYNVAAALNNGEILGFTTKSFLPNYGEFYEMRQFRPGPKKVRMISFGGKEIPFGPQILYQAAEMKELVVSAEICEDVWSPIPPSIDAAREGAVILVNCSASDETIGKDSYREELIKGQSARLIAGYVYANAGDGESTTDVVFGGHNIIAENGTILKEARRFANEMILSEIDICRLLSERRKNTTFLTKEERILPRILFTIPVEETDLTREFSPAPFVPQNQSERDRRCEEILMIQAMGLKKRLVHTNSRTAVVGISGGLDSTLALLVTAKAFYMAGKKREDIIAVTMPCFGTSDRTYNNSWELMRTLGISCKEINIKEAVSLHFSDIGHDSSIHDGTYENSQARERTQILMDYASVVKGIVVGTGDLSELALGWCTYNGDHMSMYGVNASIPKTLIRWMIDAISEMPEFAASRPVLQDILDTPISPELLPPDAEGKIAQHTEDLVGPYALHDFYLYYTLRFGYAPRKVYTLACRAFEGDFDGETIKKWLKTFYRRFFTQQFKRSCLPDGVKVGSVSLSPRGDWRMPSDASARLWLDEVDSL